MRSFVFPVILLGSLIHHSESGFAFNNVGPYSMAQGISVGNPAQISPVLLLPTSIVNPLNGIGGGSAISSFLGGSSPQAFIPNAGLHVGQIQTTFLRGSAPVAPEPKLPRILPPIDAYAVSAVKGKGPSVFISPTNLQISHHHVLMTPKAAEPPKDVDTSFPPAQPPANVSVPIETKVVGVKKVELPQPPGMRKTERDGDHLTFPPPNPLPSPTFGVAEEDDYTGDGFAQASLLLGNGGDLSDSE